MFVYVHMGWFHLYYKKLFCVFTVKLIDYQQSYEVLVSV